MTRKRTSGLSRTDLAQMFSWPSYFLRNGKLVADDGKPVRMLDGTAIPSFTSKAKANTWLAKNHIAGQVLGVYH